MVRQINLLSIYLLHSARRHHTQSQYRTAHAGPRKGQVVRHFDTSQAISASGTSGSI